MDAGLTERVAGLAVTPVCENPSDQVTAQGAAPVRAAWTVADAPAQTVVEPTTVAVGLGFTVTTALPVAVPEQTASDTAVTE